MLRQVIACPVCQHPIEHHFELVWVHMTCTPPAPERPVAPPTRQWSLGVTTLTRCDLCGVTHVGNPHPTLARHEKRAVKKMLRDW
jgi:hypothetical protein